MGVEPERYEVSVSYEQWPIDGCTLADARERTARRESLPGADTQEVEDQINSGFRSLIGDQRLVAVGHAAGSHSQPQIIPAGEWTAPTRIDWRQSSIENSRSASQFHNVRIFPVVMAPNCVDILAGLPLREAFNRFVLGDPEVVALSESGFKAAPEFKRVFIEGYRSEHGDGHNWPLAYDRWRISFIIHPDPRRRSIFDRRDPPAPWGIANGMDSLIDRYKALINLLRDGRLDAVGMPVAQGHPPRILHSVWNHEEFWFDAIKGDILETNYTSETRYDQYIRRWTGVVLERPRSDLFHVEPTTHDGLRPSTSELIGASKSSPSRVRVETTITAYNQCRDWLLGEMRASPNKKVGLKSEWRQKALAKWPNSLSGSSFNRAWSEAINISGATSWAASGAPKRSVG